MGSVPVALQNARGMVRCRMKLLLLFWVALGLNVAIALIAPRTTVATILFTETFDYSDGELQQASHGVWLRHSGTTDGQSIINRALFINDDGTKDYSRALGDHPPLKHGAVYAAFDLNVSSVDPPANTSSTAPYFAHFSEEFGGNSPQVVSRLVMNPGSVAGTFRLGIVRGGGETASTTAWGVNLPTGVEHRVVISYDLDAAVSTLWVNPASASSAHVTNATGAGVPIFGLNWFCFRIDGLSGRSGDKTIDNLMVATTFAEVQAAGDAVALPGDFNGDGHVDGADFGIWQTNFPRASGMTSSTGDADGDGDVDGADFVVWQTNFSVTPSTAVSAPEPSAILLAGLTVLALIALNVPLHFKPRSCNPWALLAPRITSPSEQTQSHRPTAA
jgi:hypothetical protein